MSRSCIPGLLCREVSLSEVPAVERYVDKSLAKVFQDPLPMWDYYMWDTPSESGDRSFYVDPSKVIDLTSQMVNGRILWQAPVGEWTVLTTYMESTGVTNSPAVEEGTGLEVDKINKRYIGDHFNAYIGEIIRRIPPQDRKTWKVVVEDSYETGSQNWTDDMAEVFEKTYGYSPIPWLPVLTISMGWKAGWKIMVIGDSLENSSCTVVSLTRLPESSGVREALAT